jgi:hypothetical protein
VTDRIAAGCVGKQHRRDYPLSKTNLPLLDAFAALLPALRAGAACRDALMRSSIFQAAD